MGYSSEPAGEYAEYKGSITLHTCEDTERSREPTSGCSTQEEQMSSEMMWFLGGFWIGGALGMLALGMFAANRIAR